MAVCRAPSRLRDWWADDFGATCIAQNHGGAFGMAKKYAVLRTKTPQPSGGFIEAFELGLVDLSAWGDQYYDLSGYPYPDEVQAFVHDWANLSDDFAVAIRKMNELAHGNNAPGATVNVEESPEGPGTSEKSAAK